MMTAGADWRTFSDQATNTLSRVAVASSCSAFTSDPYAESARQQTSLAGVGTASWKEGGGQLQRAAKIGAGKENEAARRELRMQVQQKKAREDIRYACLCFLALPFVRHTACHITRGFSAQRNDFLRMASCVMRRSWEVYGEMHL